MAAPTILDAAPVSTAPSTAPAAPGSSGFDAVLVMQNLAAPAVVADVAQLDAADTADLLASEDAPEDEDLDEELEASLAFLAAMLPVPAQGSSGDFSPGGQGSGEGGGDADAATPSKARPEARLTDTAAELLGAATSQAHRDAATASLLSDAVEEPSIASADGASSAQRSLELLSSLQRPAALAAAAATPGETIATSVRDPRWAEDFQTRVTLLVRAGESSASLALTPVDLGPVEVNVTVKDAQATIHFGAAQAETRALIEASLPKLRELLSAQGFNLLDASVSSGFSRSQQQAFLSGGARAEAEAETAAAESRVIRQRGLLDLYA